MWVVFSLQMLIRESTLPSKKLWILLFFSNIKVCIASEKYPYIQSSLKQSLNRERKQLMEFKISESKLKHLYLFCQRLEFWIHKKVKLWHSLELPKEQNYHSDVPKVHFVLCVVPFYFEIWARFCFEMHERIRAKKKFSQFVARRDECSKDNYDYRWLWKKSLTMDYLFPQKHFIQKDHMVQRFQGHWKVLSDQRELNFALNPKVSISRSLSST